MKICWWSGRAHVVFAVGIGIFVGLCGILPHWQFSMERGAVAWFFNSYDEGFYGWAAIHDPVVHRLLAGVVLKTLAVLCGGNLVVTMIAADFIFPCLVVVAACFAMRAITRTVGGMVVAALLSVMSAELLAFRSVLSPTYVAFPSVKSLMMALDGRPDGIFPLGNETSVFWIFRTPEPQVTWVVMFLIMGCAFRFIKSGSPRWWVAYAVTLFVGAFGYFLVTLPLYGALSLAGLILVRRTREIGLKLALPAIGGGALILILAAVSAASSGAGSLLFDSRRPVFLLSGLMGVVIFLSIAAFAWRRKQLSPQTAVAMAFAIGPLLMANQQVITGKLLYLFNFENYGFSQLVAVAAVMLPGVAMTDAYSESWKTLRAWVAGGVAIGLAGVLLRSQTLGYEWNLAFNRSQASYADAIVAAGEEAKGKLAVQDVFVADNLALILGWKPDFLLSREMYYARSISKLRFINDVPPERAEIRPRFFEWMALTGVTLEKFSDWLDAVVDPTLPDWQGRFIAGGFLYSQADFWGPLTHERGMRTEWIAAEKESLLEDYLEYLAAGEYLKSPLLMLGDWKSGDIERFREIGRVRKLESVGQVRAVLLRPRRKTVAADEP